MQKVYNSLKAIEGVVYDILPPRLNHLVDCFKLEFKLSSNNWNELNSIFKDENSVLVLGKRNIKYYISKATIEEEIEYLTTLLDPYYEHSDNHTEWKYQIELREKINNLKTQL